MKVTIAAFLATSLALFAESWESTDGKTITADFVRLQDDSLTLRTGDKEYSVPLSRLSAKSQTYARFLQEKMKGLVSQNLDTAIIAESSLLDAIGLDPKLAEGRHFLMEGNVKSIAKSSSLGSSPLTTAVIVLSAGTRMELDMSGEADGKTTKVRVESGKVVLTKATTYSDGKWKDFDDSKILLETGQAVIFRSHVERGKIVCTAIATLDEIVKAKVAKAPLSKELTAEEKASIERIKIRVEFLESQLSGSVGKPSADGKGFLGPQGAEYTDAEKSSMRSELARLKAELASMTKSASPDGLRPDRPIRP